MGFNPLGWVSDRIEDLGNIPGSVSDFVNDPIQSITDLGSRIDDEIFQPVINYLKPEIPALGDLPDLSRTSSRNLRINAASNIAAIPVVYGTVRVSGTRVFRNVSGATNEYLWIVLAVSEGPVEALDTVYLDDIPSNDAKWGSTVQITKYTGTDTQTADAGLVAAFPAVWTSNHRLRGVAYVVVRLTFDANIYSRLPVINVDVRGRRVLDVRDGVTKHSANPALCIYDYLTHARYGKGLAASLIDSASFVDAANYSDTLMAAYAGGPNITTFACNGLVDTDQDIKRNLEDLLTSCRGFLPYSGGRYRLVIDRDIPATYAFAADNIIGGWSVNSGSKRTRLNRAKARFINPDKNWQPDLAITDSAALRALDNGLPLEREARYPFETSYYRALYHTEVAVKRSRQGLACAFLASPEALKVEIADVVTITHATPGWTAKKFRAMGLTLRADGLVAVSVIEHEPTVYDRTVPVAAATPPDTTLPDPRTVPAPVLLPPESGTAHLITGSDGTIISRIKASCAPSPSIYVIGYEYEYKRTADTDWVPAGSTASRTDVTVMIGPVQDGAEYDVRARAFNAMGFYSAYAAILGYVVIGKLEVPPPPTQFLIWRDADGTRRFTWVDPSPRPVDLAGYRVKHILGTSGTWASMTQTHSGLLQSSPWETNQLAAGTYTFAIAAVDTTGNESTAVYIQATLGDPRMSAALDIETPHLSGWPGTKTNGWVDPATGWLVGTDSKTWADLATAGKTWGTWTSWPQASNQLTYTHTTIDVGLVTRFTPLVSADFIGTAVLEVRTSNDNVVWSAWAVPSGQVTARYVGARAIVSGNGAVLKTMTIILDATPVTEDVNDLNTASLTGVYRLGVGDIRLPITKVYSLIRGVSVTLQNVGPGWSWELIDKGTSPGPRIKIYNASNALADAIIDATIRGV